MQEHGTFGHARGAAGVLKNSNVVACDHWFDKCGSLSEAQGLIEFDGTWQLKVWHQAFHIADHKVHHSPFGHAEHVAHGTQHHVIDLSFCEALLQRDCKVFNDHDGLGTRVLELVLKFARGVQGVHIDHHQAGTQNGRYRYRILRHVGHHNGNAVAFF